MNIFENRLFPIFMTTILVVTYIVSDKVFIKCEWGSVCARVHTDSISEVPYDEKIGADQQENNLNEIPALLATKKKDFNDKNERVKISEQAVNATNDELAKTVKAQNLAAANASTLEADTKLLNERKTALDANFKNQNADLTRFKTDSNAAEKQVQEIRQQVAERYSKRWMFMFLTAAFMLLCLAAIIISITVIRESIGALDDESKMLWGLPVYEYWQSIAAASAVIFGAVIWYWFEDDYLDVVIPLYGKTIWANGDVSKGLVHFVNCAGFTATIWLVFAANAVLFAVKSKRGNFFAAKIKIYKVEKDSLERTLAAETDVAKQTALTEQIAKIEQRLSTLKALIITQLTLHKRNITTVLYVGGLMLFVGMLRMKILTDWHLLFVSTDISNSFYKLLEDFFKSLLTVQAGFYSILLMVMYLPVIYAMPSVDSKETAGDSNLLEKLGLPFSTEFLTKFFAVFLPTLASPVVDLFNYMLGKTG